MYNKNYQVRDLQKPKFKFQWIAIFILNAFTKHILIVNIMTASNDD